MQNFYLGVGRLSCSKVKLLPPQGTKKTLLKVRFINIGTKSTNELTIYLPTRRKYLIIECTDLKTRRESLWKLKNTKNKVLDSDIAYILMISIDIDGDSTRFPAILPDVKVFLTKSNILRSKNRPPKIKNHNFDC